jgi:radical SAM-linked protein
MRIRVRYTKRGKVRFTSHRDMARVWERTLRRADFPIAYTEGFSPRPKLHFGLALPTTYESDGEYLDIDLADALAVPVDSIPEILSPLLPGGVEVTAAAETDRGEMSLQQAVTSCSWWMQVDGLSQSRCSAAAASALAATSLPYTRERKGKMVTDDVRPQMRSIEIVGGDDGVELTTELGTQPRLMRPTDLLGVLELAGEVRVARRTHQWMSPDGARREPLPAGATRVARTVVRAS